MSFFWETIFIPDINNLSVFTVLEKLEPIINNNDRKNNSINRNEILHYYSDIIDVNNITTNSRILERESYNYGLEITDTYLHIQ